MGGGEEETEGARGPPVIAYRDADAPFGARQGSRDMTGGVSWLARSLAGANDDSSSFKLWSRAFNLLVSSYWPGAHRGQALYL